MSDHDDWIEWKGGECPVGALDTIEIKFRPAVAGAESPVFRIDAAHRLTGGWLHNGGAGDIIAYRVVKP